MECMNCDGEMTTTRENVPYKSLPGTVLQGVEVSRCSTCGHVEFAIPAIEQLNQLLAEHVIATPGRLNGGEIRFLRTFLGYSSADFAKLMGSTASTISRWESDTQPMGNHADLFLRALIVIGKKVESYPIDKFAELAIADAPAKPTPTYFKRQSKRWKQTDAAA
jgi:putative zinc finger/helix-turn-helix YgiT family protein